MRLCSLVDFPVLYSSSFSLFFTQGVSLPSSSHLYPFQVGNSTYLAAAGVVQDQSLTETAIIFKAVTIDPQNTDYYNRY